MGSLYIGWQGWLNDNYCTIVQTHFGHIGNLPIIVANSALCICDTIGD